MTKANEGVQIDATCHHHLVEMHCCQVIQALVAKAGATSKAGCGLKFGAYIHGLA